MKYENSSLERHAYGRTRTALSVETRERGLLEVEQREDSERRKGSTACKYDIGAKSAEGLVRDLTNVRGVDMVVRGENGEKYIDFAARPNRNNRGECKLYGRPADVKSGGALVYALYKQDWTEDDLLPGKEYVAFVLLEKASEAKDKIEGLCDWTAILSREQFFELCRKASRKGIRGTLHLNTRGDVSFQKTPLEKLRNMIREGIEHGTIETLEGYLLDRA